MSCSAELPPFIAECSGKPFRERTIQVIGRNVYRDGVKCARVVLETPEKLVCVYRGKNRYARKHFEGQFIELIKVFAA